MHKKECFWEKWIFIKQESVITCVKGCNVVASMMLLNGASKNKPDKGRPEKTSKKIKYYSWIRQVCLRKRVYIYNMP